MRPSTTVREQSRQLDWDALEHMLDEHGYATLPALLTPHECRDLIELYRDESKFRSRIDMARHRFGIGEYQYLTYPLPPLVQELREALYPHLASIAQRWEERLGSAVIYPEDLSSFLQQCHARGQTKPTPLLLWYEAGGYNCLHQDLYGEVAFPFQMVFVLNQRGVDYVGGESLLIEQRPRAQSLGRVITLEQGEGLIFPTHHRPVAGTRGWYRANVRHGVSPLTSGFRYSLGIIFHDAK
jgi:uncharacterized protein